MTIAVATTSLLPQHVGMDKQQAADDDLSQQTSTSDASVLLRIMMEVAARRSEGFSGLGVVVCRDLEGLPVAALGPHSLAPTESDGCRAYCTVEALLTLAQKTNPRHDGFHLLRTGTLALECVAQFASPPLDFVRRHPNRDWPTGARQMTALLMSTMSQVSVAAVISAEGTIQMYEAGRLTNMAHSA